MNNVIVSACIITYNQEDYIRECLEGAVSQLVSFDYEIVIGDDCSTDNTFAICQEFALKYPKIVRLFPRKKNLGMIGNWIKTIEDSKGKYIALCEGDDYWTDPMKLQKQVDFLEANPEYVLCFHQVSILKTDGSIVDDFVTKVPNSYESIETLARLGNYIHTPSVVFRNVIKEFPFEFELSPIGDYFLYMMLAEHGKLKYLDENMAVYRYNVGVISKMSGLDIANNNVTMYSCMLSYLRNENAKLIILDKQITVVTNHYKSIELDYKNAFISRHFIFMKIKTSIIFFKDPKKILRKIKNKLSKLI
jgi:glycosyltransferase involved in cell wall biosynthesis